VLGTLVSGRILDAAAPAAHATPSAAPPSAALANDALDDTSDCRCRVASRIAPSAG